MQLNSIRVFPGDAETSLVTTAGRQPLSIRNAGDFDRLARELGRFSAVPVQVTDELRLPPPEEGVFYICRPDVLDRSLAAETERPRLLAAHTVVVDIVRTYALREAERLALAAAVAMEDYFQWQEERDTKNGAALWGLKTVGKMLGSSWQHTPIWEGPNYALLRDSKGRGLTEFLAEYLRAYANLL